MDREGWRAAVHGVAKSQAQLSNFTFTFHFYALEKEMATHPSVLAWRIPGSQGKSRGPHPEITWAPRGNHVGPTRKSRGPHGEIT